MHRPRNLYAFLAWQGSFGFQKLDGDNVARALGAAVHAVFRGSLWLVALMKKSWETLDCRYVPRMDLAVLVLAVMTDVGRCQYKK